MSGITAEVRKIQRCLHLIQTTYNYVWWEDTELHFLNSPQPTFRMRKVQIWIRWHLIVREKEELGPICRSRSSQLVPNSKSSPSWDTWVEFVARSTSLRCAACSRCSLRAPAELDWPSSGLEEHEHPYTVYNISLQQASCWSIGTYQLSQRRPFLRILQQNPLIL